MLSISKWLFRRHAAAGAGAHIGADVLLAAGAARHLRRPRPRAPPPRREPGCRRAGHAGQLHTSIAISTLHNVEMSAHLFSLREIQPMTECFDEECDKDRCLLRSPRHQIIILYFCTNKRLLYIKTISFNNKLKRTSTKPYYLVLTKISEILLISQY